MQGSKGGAFPGADLRRGQAWKSSAERPPGNHARKKRSEKEWCLLKKGCLGTRVRYFYKYQVKGFTEGDSPQKSPLLPCRKVEGFAFRGAELLDRFQVKRVKGFASPGGVFYWRPKGARRPAQGKGRPTAREPGGGRRTEQARKRKPDRERQGRRGLSFMKW